MTSSTKPEVHNAPQRRQTTTESWLRATGTETLMKFGHVVFEICGRTDRHTDTLTAILRIAPGSAVIRNYISKTAKELDVDGYSSIHTSDVTQTRGNSRKLLKHHSASVHDANLFHHRVVNPWNKLPDSVVLAPSMSSFKARLYKLVINTGSQYSVLICNL